MIADSLRLAAHGRRLAVSALLGCMIILVAGGCHRVPFEDLWDAPQQVEIDGRTFTLDGGALRSYWPGGPDTSGSPLMAIATLTGSDTTMPFPSTLHADRVWVIRSPSEVWEAGLQASSNPRPKYEAEYSATGGPLWPTGILVSVAAPVRSADGGTWLLRDPEVRITRVE